jgi:shikimate dehydrogenase
VDEQEARAAALVMALTRRFGADRARAGSAGDLGELLRAADGLVNATPVGMVAHPGMPVSAASLRPDLWVADVVYRPMETELLRQAKRLGCRTLHGGGMVVFQAADAFRLFTGIEPDAERMLGHLAELIDS